MGGFSERWNRCWRPPATAPLLSRERVSMLYFFSYTFIPLSSITFPHIGIFCLTANGSATSRRPSSSTRSACCSSGCRRYFSAWRPTPPGTCRRSPRSSTPGAPSRMPVRPCRSTQRDRLRAGAAGDDVILRLVDGYAPLWLAVAAVGGGHGGSDGERLADPRAVDDVHRGRVRVLRRQGPLRRSGAGRHGRHLCRDHHSRRLHHRAAAAAVDLRRRDPICVCGLLGADAAARRRAVLAQEHPLGRTRECAVGGGGRARCGRIHRPSPRPPRAWPCRCGPYTAPNHHPLSRRHDGAGHAARGPDDAHLRPAMFVVSRQQYAPIRYQQYHVLLS